MLNSNLWTVIVMCDVKEIAIASIVLGVLMGVAGIAWSVVIKNGRARYAWTRKHRVEGVAATIHGLIMVFFMVMPILWSGYGNYYTPLLLTMDEVTYPRTNNNSLILIPLSYLLLSNLLISTSTGNTRNGWTLYPPLSTQGSTLVPITISNIIASLILAGYSSTFTSLNFTITIIHCRVAGVTLLILDLYEYGILTVSILLITSLPFLTGALLMLATDLSLHTIFFNGLLGGSPLLYQHLFWFFGHPEVYVLMLPGFCLLTLTLRLSYSLSIFGNQCVSLSICCIGYFGFLVWSHHMYTSGISVDCRTLFTLSTFLIAIPTSSKLASWLLTLLTAAETGLIT